METMLVWLDFLKSKPDIFVLIDVLPYPINGNFDDPDLLKLLSRADAFMPSEAEAESMMPGHEAEIFCREIAARGPKIVVIKQGDHGAAIYDRNSNVFKQILPYPAEIDDLTGAGDSFCGGFSIGYHKTKDPFQAALYGTVSASFIIEGFGGLHALEIGSTRAKRRLLDLEKANFFDDL